MLDYRCKHLRRIEVPIAEEKAGLEDTEGRPGCVPPESESGGGTGNWSSAGLHEPVFPLL